MKESSTKGLETGNTAGKGEIAPLPTVLSKDLYCSHFNTRACLGKG